jgi:putative DNA methylase
MRNPENTTRKKLIEVAMPLEEINDEAAQRNTKSPKGWPSTFHKWWSPKPLAIARSVILAQILDDPSAHPELFATRTEQDEERQRLLRLITKAAKWSENSSPDVRREIRAELDRALKGEEKGIRFLDPFCGSSAIPLSAQFLGVESTGADLNPVAFLISKGLLELPSQDWNQLRLPGQSQATLDQTGLSTDKLASLFEHYAKILKQTLFSEVGHLYPGSGLHYDKNLNTPAAYFWAWAVQSPNPSFSECWTPLLSTFVLCNRAGKEVVIQPIVNGKELSFELVEGAAAAARLQTARKGTKSGRGANFRCVYTDDPITGNYIKEQGRLGQISIIPTAVAIDQGGKRTYSAPSPDEQYARPYKASIPEDLQLPFNPRAFWSPPYGFDTFGSLFTERQHKFLLALASQIPQVCSDARIELSAAGNNSSLVEMAVEAVAVYLTVVLNRLANYNSTLNAWLPKDNAIGPAMPQQTIGVSWGFAEANPFGKTSGSLDACINVIASCIRACTPNAPGKSISAPVQDLRLQNQKFIISTDPPYYDNIPYASLSDYFYYWSRKALKEIYPAQFATIATPVVSEIIADQYREGDKESAEARFLTELGKALTTIKNLQDPRFPITIYYAFKQTESDSETGTRITGWETFLQAVFSAGLAVTATWPIRTERKGRMRASEANTLASSILLCCRPRTLNAAKISFSEFKRKIRQELPESLRILEKTNLAPVDFLQAAIGKGIEVFSNHQLIYDASDQAVTPRQALAEIQSAVEDLLHQELQGCDQDTKFAVTLFEAYGYNEVDFGEVEPLALALNVSVEGVASSGILRAISGRVQLIRREELSDSWDPTHDSRLSTWEATQHLIKRLESEGENGAAELLIRLQRTMAASDLSSNCKALAYQLFTFCEKSKQADEARAYNSLVSCWSELERLAAAQGTETAVQASLI